MNNLHATCRWHVAVTGANTGERVDRRQWRIKGNERVAAVGEGRRCTVTEDIRRAPQQEATIIFAEGKNVTKSGRYLPEWYLNTGGYLHPYVR